MRNSFQLTRTSSKFLALSIPLLTLLIASSLALLLQCLLDAIYDPHGKSVLMLSIQLASTAWLNYQILLIYQWICHMDLYCLRKVTEVVKTIVYCCLRLYCPQNTLSHNYCYNCIRSHYDPWESFYNSKHWSLPFLHSTANSM